MINTQFVNHQSIYLHLSQRTNVHVILSEREFVFNIHTLTSLQFNLPTQMWHKPVPITITDSTRTSSHKKKREIYMTPHKHFQANTHTHTRTHTKTNWVCFAVSCEPWKVRQKWCEKLNHLLSIYQSQEYSPPDDISAKGKHGRHAKKQSTSTTHSLVDENYLLQRSLIYVKSPKSVSTFLSADHFLKWWGFTCVKDWKHNFQNY